MQQVLLKLRSWRDETVAALRSDSGDRSVELALKRELDRAIACVELCDRYAIDPQGKVTVLPESRTRTPSSEYRLVEDHETDDRAHWTEVHVDGEPVRPAPGDAILTRLEEHA